MNYKKSTCLSYQISYIQKNSLTCDMQIFEIVYLNIVFSLKFGENSLPQGVKMWQTIVNKATQLFVLLFNSFLRIDS